jgi:hypothetical protein
LDTVTILRDLWRLRSAVVMVALLALIAGTAVIYKVSVPADLESRRYEVGIATARILVDTPSSQVVEVAPKGSDSLGVRANLLASLMVDGVVKAAIAQRAGLPPRKLIGITEAATEPSPVAKPPSPRDFVLTTRVVTNAGGDQLPIIEVDAQAPDRAGAARLGAAAIAGLRDYLDSKAARQRIADANRLHVTGLGAPQATTEARGPSTTLAIVLAFVIFAFGCVSILAILALVRSWRAASSREELEDEAATADSALHPVDDPIDDWFDAQPRRALSAPPSAGAAPREHDQPRAKSV